MQNKIVTLIASVLKPVDDTRMFEKIGLSLHRSNKYEVNIIGFQTKNKSLCSEIRMIQAFRFSRLSIHRFFAPIKFFRTALSIKPALLIISTHELIIPAVLYKLVYSKARLVYDVQENYYRNMLHQGGFSKPITLVLAIWIRAKELVSKLFFGKYILAEESYTKEFSFSNAKNVIVLNKYYPISHTTSNQANKSSSTTISNIKLIYSGTIHEVYGIHQTIGLAKGLAEILNIDLLVIGSTKINDTLKYLVKLNKKYSWLTLNIDSDPIPHQEIIASIQQADFGIVSHQPVPSIANCFPTRIYELMAFQKPILLQDHPLWTNYCNRWDSAIAFDFNHVDAAWVAEQMTKRTFYQHGQPDDIYWKSEEEKLLSSLDGIFS